MTNYQTFLNEISPYIVVVGSFGREEESPLSDIDCFLRSRPRTELNEDFSNETYMDEILSIVKKYDLEWSSVISGHIAVERQPGFPRMIEISSHYRIPYKNEPFYREVDGVYLMCARDDKHCAYEDCYDSAEWDESAEDMVIKHPLPDFEAPVLSRPGMPNGKDFEGAHSSTRGIKPLDTQIRSAQARVSGKTECKASEHEH